MLRKRLVLVLLKSLRLLLNPTGYLMIRKVVIVPVFPFIYEAISEIDHLMCSTCVRCFVFVFVSLLDGLSMHLARGRSTLFERVRLRRDAAWKANGSMSTHTATKHACVRRAARDQLPS